MVYLQFDQRLIALAGKCFHLAAILRRGGLGGGGGILSTRKKKKKKTALTRLTATPPNRCHTQSPETRFEPYVSHCNNDTRASFKLYRAPQTQAGDGDIAR